MTSSLSSKTSQPSRPSFACGTDYSYVLFQSVSDGRASSVPVTLPTIPEMTVPRGPPPLIPFTVHDVAGLTPHIDSHVSPHRATANAAMPVQVTNQDAPMHVGLSPSAYITTPLVRTRAGVAHMQTVMPGLNTPTCAVAPGVHRLVTSSDVEPRVRVTDHYQMPILAPPTVYTTPASSLPTALTGLTHAPVGSISTGVTRMPTSLMPTVPATVYHNPVGTNVPHVRLPKLNMKRFNGDLTKWTTFWDSFSSSIHTNPSLSSINKFNYLISLLESTAAEAIAGLTPTDANYEEAVSVLQRRFGNPQMIINRIWRRC